MPLPKQSKPIIRITLPIASSVGLGDVISSASEKIGFRPCGGCTQRAATLNRLIGFAPITENR